jgi:alkylation response protein AidB-like acyl-CoA dehydrogenase
MVPYLTDDQAELRAQVRKFLVARSPLTEVRRLMATETGYDPAVWKVMADQLGLQSLGIHEEFGGSGSNPVEQCLVIEEMGYALIGAPFISCALAAVALQSACAPEVTRPWLTGIASGRTVATMCVADNSRPTARDGIIAESEHGGWMLTGRAPLVTDGVSADVFAVVASVAGKLALFLVDPTSPTTLVTDQPTLDETRKLARVDFDRSPAELLTSTGVTEIIDHVFDVAAILLSAESLGGARRALDMSVAYAGQREQFGHLIGSFQAIKHKCADMHVLVESCRSIVFYASRLLGSPADRNEVPAVASLAKAYCTDAFFNVAAECLQIHGGIGFTWEHDAHLFFKRASSSRLMYGDPSAHRERLVQLVGMAV